MGLEWSFLGAICLSITSSSFLQAIGPGKGCHDHSGLLLKFLHPFRLPIGQKLDRNPENQGEDQQQGKQNQGPLLTTGQQVKLSNKSFEHLWLNVAKHISHINLISQWKGKRVITLL